MSTRTKKPRKSSQKRIYLSKALSIHPADFEVLSERARSLGLNFSQYLVICAKRDAERRGSLVIDPHAPPGSEKPAAGDKW